MSLNLQQTALGQVDPVNTPAAIRSALEDTQGNILKSNGRDNSIHLFVRFTGPSAEARAWVQMMGRRVTSAWQQGLAAKAYRVSGSDGGVFVNLCLSAAGYETLGLGSAMPDDPSFRAGAKAAVQYLNDPPVSHWQPGFQGDIHALVIVAADDAAETAKAAKEIVATLAGVAVLVDQEVGAAMRLDRSGAVTTDRSGTVHEHFGFADGVSQPLFFDKDIEAARLNSGGFDRYDPSAPLDLVLLKDPGGGPNGYGSYLVYRKLAQNVAGFRRDEAQLATILAQAARGADATPTELECRLASGYIVGRFRDGTPVEGQAVDGWTNGPNNFNFDDDVDGVKCPFHAHLRKMNPRGDKARQFGLPPGEDRARRIARRAVSYGPLTLNPGPDDEVGLLFICAQSSIVDQFEFLQATWANFTDFLRPATGLDPIIGEPAPGAAGVPQQWPRVYGLFNGLSFATDPPAPVSPFVPYQFGQWVKMLGGEYFFLPSLSFLTSAGAGS